MKSNTVKRLLVGAIAIVITGCANPVNRTTYDRYREAALAAESRGDFATAEQAYYRAAENVRWGNLGDNAEMYALYDLGRIKRVVGKLGESEELLRRAAEIDSKLRSTYGPSKGGPTGYILAELAATYLAEGKLSEGIQILDKLEPIAAEYSGGPRLFMKQTFSKYSQALSARSDLQNAQRFAKIAESLE
ncbi:MAG: hypothetical protein AB1697_00680 [Pseudomonadota bacterium]